MSELPTKKDFSQTVNSPYQLQRRDGAAVPLALIDLKDGLSDSTQEQFSLVFRGPTAFVLPQQTYKLEHERFGAFDLFIVPVSKDQAGTYYEAVLNRFARKQEVEA